MFMDQWPLHGPADLAARVAAGNDPSIQQDGFVAVLLDADRRVIAAATYPSASASDAFGEGRGEASTISAVALTRSPAPAGVIDRLSALAPGVPHGHLLWARDGKWGRMGDSMERAEPLLDLSRELPALLAAGQWFDRCVAAGTATGRVGDVLDSRGLRDALICYTFRSQRHDELIDALRRHEQTPGASPSIPVIAPSVTGKAPIPRDGRAGPRGTRGHGDCAASPRQPGRSEAGIVP